MNQHTLGLIALLAAAANGWVLYKSKSHNKLTSSFTLLGLALFTENCLEFVVSYIAVTSPENIEFVMHLVIASLYVMFLAMLNFCVVASDWRYGRSVLIGMSVWAFTIFSLHLSGLLITGYEVIAHSIISSPGPFAQLWLLYAFLICFLSTAVLGFGIRSNNREEAKKALVALKGTTWITAAVMIPALLRLTGISASTGIILPIASVICLYVLIREKQHYFIEFERSVLDQWTEFIFKWKLIYFLVFKTRGFDKTEWTELVERLHIEAALYRSGNNVKKAARFLGWAETTFRDRRKKHFG